ncbi:hypothetical protein SAMN05216368_10449 [Cryobacterium flavum]|uniref:DUF3558 domain-containing protein n=1 Tax=Cryobacterium flavum TaxID=1424659 RepID=A0A4R8V115_9MICO|nr:hypothetical protein [Cryobacterium flavum]TFB74443.1 hypothetical protein E3O21_13750 [Cryobacterium flavum]SDN16250.1 hypothetical protein SAMN05216368_10449 [Cryobacterium flavum]
MLRRTLILPIVSLALVALSGCAAEPVPEPSATSTTSPTATPAAATSPLSCDDIAAPGDIANVFADPAGTVPTPVAAMQPSTFLVEYSVPALGGLSCSWRVGAAAGNPMDHQSDSDWAYLSVKVLPGAADTWAPNDSGAGPADPLTSIGGIEAATGCGDPGCFISAPVGDAWVEITLSTNSFGTRDVRFDGMTSDAIVAQMTPLAASVYTTLTDAEPSQVAWPAVALTPREPACTGALKPQGIAMALGVDSLEYEIFDSSNMNPVYFDGFVSQAAGLFRCDVRADGVLGTSIHVGYGLAGIVDTMITEPDSQAALSPIVLEGAVEGEHAVQVCADPSGYCTVIFSLGESAYSVESVSQAVAVAEAIIAQAR